ncbi:hypothetical protein pkur_cds_681 [Pandoravirus kuranda]|uniref:Uncharacterized protein n=2 Tax=Pandoravirus TaxID=2060084 RepID=A0AA95EDJ8_9VIRU|nr:hypothetical protein pneo_cds_734 [Pandoravirus neocaledonia]AVK76341.1 hypothetical protein pneo_cds_734 [Pandoravirus neocaledonia]WBR14855.1 hypothetical protein pkur_cds_681 [Pandoravirus kuranda]
MDTIAPACLPSRSPTQPGFTGAASGDQLHALYECAIEFRKPKPRPAVGSFESGLASAFGSRRRSPNSRSRPGLLPHAMAHSFIANASGDVPRDSALPARHHADVVPKEVFDADGACLEHQSQEYASPLQTPPQHMLHDPSPHRRRVVSRRDRDDGCQEEDRLCRVGRCCAVQADAQPAPDARSLPISPCSRRLGRTVSLLALVAVWTALAYLACALAPRVCAH